MRENKTGVLEETLARSLNFHERENGDTQNYKKNSCFSSSERERREEIRTRKKTARERRESGVVFLICFYLLLLLLFRGLGSDESAGEYTLNILSLSLSEFSLSFAFL